MSTSNASRRVVPASVDLPEVVDGPDQPEPPSGPAEPPPIFEEPQIVFTDGPCPPGYDRVSVDAVDADDHFTAGFSYCERRRPERAKPPHEAGFTKRP